MLEDFNALFEDWKSHSTQHRRQWKEEYQKTKKRIEDSTEQSRKVAEELRAIRLETVGEVKKLKQKSHWKLYIACLLSALVGGLLAVGISG